MYNLLSTKLLLLLVVLYKALNICILQQVSLAVDFGELTGCLSVTFGVALGSNVADSLDDTYLGPFIIGYTTYSSCTCLKLPFDFRITICYTTWHIKKKHHTYML